MRSILLAGLAAGMMLVAGCTTRGDVIQARQNLRAAQVYGDRWDVRKARRDLRDTRRAYRRDNRCGPRWGRPCGRW